MNLSGCTTKFPADSIPAVFTRQTGRSGGKGESFGRIPLLPAVIVRALRCNPLRSLLRAAPKPSPFAGIVANRDTGIISPKPQESKIKPQVLQIRFQVQDLNLRGLTAKAAELTPKAGGLTSKPGGCHTPGGRFAG
ncbi:MAG: hypothetical protein LBF62_15185 [Tannerellaceae bacterium]|nr:hypothetical protein [Tannerellaceae bacterium]